MAVTVTSTLITITSTSYTLANFATDVNAAAAGAIDVTGNVYTILGSSGNRGITINSGCGLTVGPGETLQWTLTGALPSTGMIRVENNGTLTMTSSDGSGAATIIGNTADATQSNLLINVYGNLTITGTATYPAIIEKYNGLYFRFATTTAIAVSVNYAIFRNMLVSANHFLWFSLANDPTYRLDSVSLTNITITNDSGHRDSGLGRGYGLFLYNFDGTSVTLDSFTISYVQYGVYGGPGSIFKLSNSSISYCRYSANYAMYQAAPRPYKIYVTSATNRWGRNEYAYCQPHVVFKSCSFFLNSSTYCAQSYAGSTKYVDCTFGDGSGTTVYGIYEYVGSTTVLCNPTFTNVTNVRVFANDSVYLWGRKLTLTIKDENDVAIRNATVFVEQLEGKEKWHFHTNSSGKIQDIYGDDPIFIEKEETALATYTQWSDGSSATKQHRITVAKSGYKTWHTNVVFTANRTINVTLQKELAPVDAILPQSF